MFFWFNAGYLVVMGGSIVLYDRGGDRYLFLPLAWSIERFCNSLRHVLWAIQYREYSPGLSRLILPRTALALGGMPRHADSRSASSLRASDVPGSQSARLNARVAW
jgi:hypothetical protein